MSEAPSLVTLPDDMLSCILNHLYSTSSEAALTETPCFVDSAEALFRRRKVKRAAEGAVTLGRTCRRFLEIHVENRHRWKECVQALWVSHTFDLIKSVGRQELWPELLRGIPAQDFVWVRGCWRHRSWQRELEERALDNLAAQRPSTDFAPLRQAGEPSLRLLTQWAVDTVTRVERALRTLAAQARSATRARAQEFAVVQVGTLVMDMLARLVNRAVPTMLPGLWEEVQVVAALWLTAVDSVRRSLAKWDVEGPAEGANAEVERAVFEHWDHVHNGTCTAYYWQTMRPRQMRCADDYAAFMRIWSRAAAIVHKRLQQRFDMDSGGSGRLPGADLPLTSPDDPAYGRRPLLLPAAAAKDPH